MKRLPLIGLFAVCLCACSPDKGETVREWHFVNDTILPYTPVSSQGRTQTCWAYAMTSMLESEWLRQGKDTLRLSVMYMVRQKYMKQFGQYYYSAGGEEIRGGSLGHSFLNVWQERGLMPLDAYKGHRPDAKRHDHRKLLKALRQLAEKAVDERNLSFYRSEAEKLLDETMGEVPDSFIYKGIAYTPMTFSEAVGLCADDYVQLTSFTHHPFGTWFALEVPDNWEHAPFYNVPLGKLVEYVKSALRKGRTVAWDGDISEEGFDAKSGVAFLSASEVTQEVRQQGFERFETTDDHMMHIVGMAYDDGGKLYFVLKNSWGRQGAYRGLIYMSEEYFLAKTVSVVLPKEIVTF